MTPEVSARREEVCQLLRQHPFRPFRVHLTDGRAFDVPQPFWSTGSSDFFGVGIAEGDKPDFPDYWEDVEWDRIAQVELLPALNGVTA
jgi:hypothetical protein